MSTMDTKSFLYDISPHSIPNGESSRSSSSIRGTDLPYIGQRDKRFSQDDDEGEGPSDVGAGGGVEGKAKKQKFTRSRTACLQVRSIHPSYRSVSLCSSMWDSVDQGRVNVELYLLLDPVPIA
jgi:hypothetical protein